jgi:hypothetical protein
VSGEIYYDGDFQECPELQGKDDLTPQVIKFPYRGRLYYIHEAMAEDVVSISNSRQSMLSYDKEGNINRIGNIADLDLMKIHRCLYNASGNGKLKMEKLEDGTLVPAKIMRVPIATIKSFTSRTHGSLLDIINKISGMGLEEESIEQLEKRKEAIIKLIDMKKKEMGGSAKNGQQLTIGSSAEPTSQEEASSEFSE